MNPSLQDAILEAFAIAPTNVTTIHTLEIRQAGVQDTLFIAQSRRPITAFDEDGEPHLFEASGFEFSLPPSNEEGFQSLNIAIDNIGQRASDFVKTAQASNTPVMVLYRPYLSNDFTTSQMVPPLTLFVKQVSINQIQVTGKATFMDIVNKKFPSELYTREDFPTLG